MTIGKKIGIGCLGIIVLIAAGIGVSFYLTADLTKASDQFFTLVKANKTQEAYQSTAKEFQSSTSYEDFKTFLDQTSLNKYESASWSSRSIRNDTGSLIGTVTTSDKGNFPLEIDFIREENTWKILNISMHPAGIDQNNE